MTNIVYVIGTSNGPFKIGITGNLERRRSILNVGNPSYLKILHEHKANNKEEAKLIEKELHFHYSEKHIRGEWFDFKEKDLPDIKQMIHNVTFFQVAPDNWTLERKGCDEFTADVCKKARGALGLSEEDFAKCASINLNTLKKFESKSVIPSLSTIEAIKNTLEEKGIRFIRKNAGEPLKIEI